MTMRTRVQIELPAALLRRARVPVSEPARELVTFLLESYAQNLERSQRQQAYENYYALRVAEDQDEERALLADFAVVDPQTAGCTVRLPRI
jgi:hypothetical protein